MEYILSLSFLTETGTKSTFTISGVKSNLTNTQVNSLMETIITKNVFLTSSGTLVSKSGAQLTERKITKYEVS